MHVARLLELTGAAADERQTFRAAAIKKVRVVQRREQREKRRYTRVARIATAGERAAQGRKRNVKDCGKRAPRFVARPADAVAAIRLHPVRNRYSRTLRGDEQRRAPPPDQHAP